MACSSNVPRGGIFLHILFPTQNRSPSSFRGDLYACWPADATRMCTACCLCATGLISCWESVSPVPAHPASGLAVSRAVCTERTVALWRRCLSGALTCFLAGFLLSTSPNLTEQQVGEDTPRECFNCSSVSNRLREIHVKQAYVILQCRERGLHDLGVCVYDLGRKKRIESTEEHVRSRMTVLENAARWRPVLTSDCWGQRSENCGSKQGWADSGQAT